MDTPVQRWTNQDPDAQRGDPLWNLEEPSTPGQRMLRGGAIGLLDSLTDDLHLGGTPIEAVEIDGSGVDVVTAAGTWSLPWSTIERAQVARQLGAPRHEPVATITLVDASVVPLPDSLYPDAKGDFNSMRHTARAREIVAAINAGRTEHGPTAD